MTRVKKAVGEKSNRAKPIVGISGPVVRDGTVHLAPQDMLLLDIADLRKTVAKLQVQLKRGEIERVVLEHEKRVLEGEKRLYILQGEVAKLSGEGLEQEGKYSELIEQFEEIYGLSFKEMSYDSVTAKIFISGEPVTVQEPREHSTASLTE